MFSFAAYRLPSDVLDVLALDSLPIFCTDDTDPVAPSPAAVSDTPHAPTPPIPHTGDFAAPETFVTLPEWYGGARGTFNLRPYLPAPMHLCLSDAVLWEWRQRNPIEYRRALHRARRDTALGRTPPVRDSNVLEAVPPATSPSSRAPYVLRGRRAVDDAERAAWKREAAQRYYQRKRLKNAARRPTTDKEHAEHQQCQREGARKRAEVLLQKLSALDVLASARLVQHHVDARTAAQTRTCQHIHLDGEACTNAATHAAGTVALCAQHHATYRANQQRKFYRLRMERLTPYWADLHAARLTHAASDVGQAQIVGIAEALGRTPDDVRAEVIACWRADRRRRIMREALGTEPTVHVDTIDAFEHLRATLTPEQWQSLLSVAKK